MDGVVGKASHLLYLRDPVDNLIFNKPISLIDKIPAILFGPRYRAYTTYSCGLLFGPGEVRELFVFVSSPHRRFSIAAECVD